MLLIPELLTFLAAAETENFSEVARQLGISQPSVSMQIRALESRMGVELFHRSGRSVTLTEAGQALVPLARSLAAQAVHAEEAMASHTGEIVGRLRIVCTTTAGKYLLPQLVSGLLKRHPMVSVECQVVHRGLAIERLCDGYAQIGITSLREGSDQTLEYRPFVTDRIALIAPVDHPWATREKAVTPADLATERFILREDASGTQHAVRDALAWHDLDLDDLHPVMTMGNAEAIRMAVQERIGVGFVSVLVAREAVDAGRLAMVPVEGLDITKTLYMIRDRRRPATPAQTAFWDYAFSPENELLRELPNLIGAA
jgi:DNA-binding transcriptional LysR family regulator